MIVILIIFLYLLSPAGLIAIWNMLCMEKFAIDFRAGYEKARKKDRAAYRYINVRDNRDAYIFTRILACVFWPITSFLMLTFLASDLTASRSRATSSDGEE